MTLDLLTFIPKGVDYPNFRELLGKYGNLFNQKFLYVSEHYTNEMTPDIDEFLISEYQKLGFIHVEPPYLRTATEDWCDFAAKAMLKKSKADAFLIMHPDFLVKDFPSLIQKVKEALEVNDLVGYINKTEVLIQPAFFACKRSSYEKSCKDFSAKEGYDHCDFLSEDMIKRGMMVKSLQSIGLKNKEDFFHLGGVTQGYIWGLTKDDCRRGVDYVYLYYALKMNVPMNQIYVDRVSKILSLCRNKFPNIYPETHWMRRFYEN